MSTKEGNIINLNNSSRAKTGYIDKDFRTGYRVRIKWTINSQNASNNTSNVTVETQLISTGTHYTISSSATKNGSLTINGTEYKFTTKKWLTPKGNWIHEKGVEVDYEVELDQNYFANPKDELDTQLNKALEILTEGD